MVFEQHDERRRYRRVSTECEAWLWIGDLTLRCDVFNLSEGGLGVRMPMRIGHGAMVDVSLDLGPDHGMVRGRGRIAWTSPRPPEDREVTSHPTGLELMDLLEGREGLDRYLDLAS